MITSERWERELCNLDQSVYTRCNHDVLGCSALCSIYMYVLYIIKTLLVYPAISEGVSWYSLHNISFWPKRGLSHYTCTLVKLWEC